MTARDVKLKLRGVNPVAVASSLTDKELYNHVDACFPSLTGPLAELVRRFGEFCGEGKDAVLPASASCPACGTTVDIVLE